MGEPIFSDALMRGLSWATAYWWAYMPVVLALLSYRLWMSYQRKQFISSITWTLLEIVPPPDVPKSPKLAESIFAGLHGIYAGNLAWKKMFFLGTVPYWFSMEIVSNGGETHFFVRTPEGLRDVVEANLFAQYPDAEIRQVDDYINLIPEEFPDDYSAFITELIFTKDDPYPIKTWPEFEEAGGKDEHQRIDPIAPLLEIMSALMPGEHLWVQYLIRPTGGEWVKQGQAVVDKLTGKEVPKPGDPILVVVDLLGSAIGAILEGLGIGGEPAEPKREEKKDFSLQKLTPAQKKVLEYVEYKLSRLAFKSGIRLAYLGRKDVFNLARVSTVTGMFKQLYSNNLNSFKPNPAASTKDKGIMPWLFPKDKGFFAAARTARKVEELYEAYRDRAFTDTHVVLNVEELATLWHLPGVGVQAPLLPRVQAKKGQPPPYLPIS